MYGGLNPCQDGFWHLFLGEMSMYKRAFAWFCPNIGATECPFERGSGDLMAIWAMPKWTAIFLWWCFPYANYFCWLETFRYCEIKIFVKDFWIFLESMKKKFLAEYFWLSSYVYWCRQCWQTPLIGGRFLFYLHMKGEAARASTKG